MPSLVRASMRLSELVSDLGVEAVSLPGEGWDTEVLGLSHDSRRVQSGDLYVAIAGARFDGRRFAPQAVMKGAVAVLSPPPPPQDLTVPCLVVEDPRLLMAPLAARVYGHPERDLILVGVTGTNGKSTVTHVVAAILEAADRPCGILGTLGYSFREIRIEGGRTTPEASDLYRCLRDMRDAGAGAISMEVSSHALDQGRVEGLRFDVAVFTNLSRDHLDYHGDLETYFGVKCRLFDRLRETGRAVINVDDAYGRRLIEKVPGVLTYGEGGDIRALDVELDDDGIRGRVHTPRGDIDIDSPLLGRYNLSNVLAAIAVSEALEIAPEAIARGLKQRTAIHGRLELVDGGQTFPVAIDYAHTPAALRATLESARELWGEGIILVFGCGGERDPGKRPLMGRVAGELAAVPILTADNPRGEDPHRINAAVEVGLRQSGNWDYRVIPDRREAIREALRLAAGRPSSAVVVAGKGHEDTQVLGEEIRPFSDRSEVEQALEELVGRAPGV